MTVRVVRAIRSDRTPGELARGARPPQSAQNLRGIPLGAVPTFRRCVSFW